MVGLRLLEFVVGAKGNALAEEKDPRKKTDRERGDETAAEGKVTASPSSSPSAFDSRSLFSDEVRCSRPPSSLPQSLSLSLTAMLCLTAGTCTVHGERVKVKVREKRMQSRTGLDSGRVEQQVHVHADPSFHFVSTRAPAHHVNESALCARSC